MLGKLFRRLFLTRLMALHETGRLAFYGSLALLADRRAFLRHLSPVRKKRWVVYAKPPFAGPETVLAYLSRYTHRVAISNSRLLRFDQAGVTFRYKNYRCDGADRRQVMTLSADEFIRRFLLHVLPKGFHRIRHYGLLAGATRKVVLNHVRQLLGVAPPAIHRRRGRTRRAPSTVPMLRRAHGRCRDLRASASAPRAASSCATIRDASVVTRHGLAATDRAAPVLAEQEQLALIAVRDAAIPSRAGPSAPANRTSPPKSGSSASRSALAPTGPPNTEAGANP